MDINREAPATFSGQIEIRATAETVFLKSYSKKSIEKAITGMLASLKAEAERKAATT